MQSLEVREATPDDAEQALLVLRRAITLSCVADHHNDPETLQHWLGNKTPVRFEHWLNDADSVLLVAELANRVRGVGMLLRTGKIALCYVDPDFQRQRIGSSLLLALEQRAASWHVAELELESSRDACAFYARHGYESVGAPRCALGTVRCFPFKKRVTPTR